MSKSEKCPFCGNPRCNCEYCQNEGKSGPIIYYLCGSEKTVGPTSTGDEAWHRSETCKQLAAQADLLRECLEVVRTVHNSIALGLGSDPQYYYVTLKKPVVDNAAALLPRLEDALNVS